MRQFKSIFIGISPINSYILGLLLAPQYLFVLLALLFLFVLLALLFLFVLLVAQLALASQQSFLLVPMLWFVWWDLSFVWYHRLKYKITTKKCYITIIFFITGNGRIFLCYVFVKKKSQKSSYRFRFDLTKFFIIREGQKAPRLRLKDVFCIPPPQKKRHNLAKLYPF